MLDFTIAKMNHQLWKRKLEKHISEDSVIDEQEMVSERDCKLGKWLYAEGLEKYKSWNEIHSLEGVHKDLHKLTFTIVNQKKEGQLEEAKKSLALLSEKSDKIVTLLDILEIKIKSNN